MTPFTPADADVEAVAKELRDFGEAPEDAATIAGYVLAALHARGWRPLDEAAAESAAMRAALEKLYKGLLSDPPSGPQKSVLRDDVIYHLDGQLMYQAINAVRAALAPGAGVAAHDIASLKDAPR